MTARLALTCQLAADESLSSFISRLAVRNRVSSAQDFCLDMGLTFQDCIDGDQTALTKLATLTGVSLEALEWGTLRRDGHAFRLRAERLSKASVRRSRIYVCPCCLQDDIGALGETAEPAPYGRTEWLLAVFRSCPTHACALVEIADALLRGPSTLHDFALHLRGLESKIAELATATIPRAPSRLESYTRDRLNGVATDASWLDGLDLHAAITTCEMLGALATLGATVKTKTLSQEAWHQAGDAGCRIARSGEAGVRAVFSDVQRVHPIGRSGREGPNTVFGFFYEWLANDQKAPAFEPVRDLMRRHIIETMPVGPGDVVIGQPVEKRILHSIWTASQETGRHPKRLRKVLTAAGFIGEDHKGYPDHLVLFDAERAQTFLDADQDCIPLKQVETYLNTGRVHARILAEQGFIKPFVSHIGGRDKRRASYATADLDAFLANLLEGAEPVSVAQDPAHTIPAAAKRANCTAAEIVRLILGKKLAWVGQLQNAVGYLSVLVDVPEIKRHVHGPAYEGVTARAAEKILGTTTAVVASLIRHGYLPRRTVINPINRCPVELIDLMDLEKFCDSYVSLSQICKAKNLSPRIVADRLKGVSPAFGKPEVPATFYRRVSIPDF